MIDLAVERAVRELARNAVIKREDLIQAVVRDWLVENRALKPDGQAAGLLEGLQSNAAHP